MNYNKIYDNLITRARERIIDGYVEKHHVMPRCMGGDDSKSNLVVLTPEEHFFAHVLLVKLYPEYKNLILAVQRMANGHKGKRRKKIYGWLKRKHATRMKEMQTGKGNSQFGSMWINNGVVDRKVSIKHEIPSGWVRGRVKTFIAGECEVCKIVLVGSRNKKFCDSHRPTNKGKILKTRIASDKDIEIALKMCNNDIGLSMVHLGYTEQSYGNARNRFKKILAGIV